MEFRIDSVDSLGMLRSEFTLVGAPGILAGEKPIQGFSPVELLDAKFVDAIHDVGFPEFHCHMGYHPFFNVRSPNQR